MVPGYRRGRQLCSAAAETATKSTYEGKTSSSTQLAACRGSVGSLPSGRVQRHVAGYASISIYLGRTWTWISWPSCPSTCRSTATTISSSSSDNKFQKPKAADGYGIGKGNMHKLNLAYNHTRGRLKSPFARHRPWRRHPTGCQFEPQATTSMAGCGGRIERQRQPG